MQDWHNSEHSAINRRVVKKHDVFSRIRTLKITVSKGREVLVDCLNFRARVVTEWLDQIFDKILRY